MKTIILSLFAILILASCSHEENNRIKKTIITGQVSNFEKVSEHDFIEFIYQDILAGQVKLLENIDKNGEFKFILDLDYPAEFYLKYSGLLTYYISPGDSLHFDVNEDCWSITTETYADEYAFYKVSGTSKKMNSDVAKYTAFYLDSLNNWELQNSILKKSTPLDYKSFLIQQTKERLKRISEFNQKHSTCKQFKDWVLLKTKFTEWDDLMRYRWLHPMYNKTDREEFRDSIPKEYLSFLDDWDRENKSYLLSQHYLRFLHEYSIFIYQSVPQDSSEILRKWFKNDYKKFNQYRLDLLSTAEEGFIRDVLISKYYYSQLNAKLYSKLKNIFDVGIIKDQQFRNRIQQKYKYEKELSENREFSEGSILNELKSDNDFLKALISKYPDKVIYIDFWAPWCAPCMGEMPHSDKVKKYFDDKNVTFVYLANRCEDDAWKSTIAEKKIEGEHYHLTEKQYAELGQIFGVTGIPHYALINKKGEIVNKKAPRPSSGDELIALIEKYLN